MHSHMIVKFIMYHFSYICSSYCGHRNEFVELYMDLVLNKSVEVHFKAFYAGFHKVCGGRVLELFHSHELMAVVVGKFYEASLIKGNC